MPPSVIAQQRHQNPHMFQHPGSMTPVSFARWQHDVMSGNFVGNMSGGDDNEFPNSRRHNPLYDTPPVVRRPNPTQIQDYNAGMAYGGYDHQLQNEFERLHHPNMLAGNQHMG